LKTSGFLAAAIVTISLTAPALGGTGPLWAQTVITGVCGLLMILAPPRVSLGSIPNIALAGLFLISIATFLPASWFPAPDWRNALSQLGAELPPVRTPQPWLTVHAICLLLLGLAWTYYLFAQQIDLRARITSWAAYCLGVLALAAVMTICFTFKTRIFFWPPVEQFGFFANRNQTSNVLGLGGIMIYAFGLKRLQEHRRSWWLWLYSLALLFWALIIDYSRAGIILFFFGAIAWHFYWLSISRDRRRPAIALAGLIGLVGIFAIAGGSTLARFSPKNPEAFSSQEQGRLSIQHDALAMSTTEPLLGVGLANFGALFSPERRFYNAEKIAIHPESDVLWGAVEMGWLAVALLAVLFVWWIQQCFPMASRSERRLRIAALIAVCAFVFHGFVDVSGHRIGSLWPALFLASTAIAPSKRFFSSASIPWIFRAIGLFFVGVSAWWFASVGGMRVLPTPVTLEQLNSEADQAVANENYPEAVGLASAALRIAPLDWRAYQTRATAQLAIGRKDEAKHDFQIAHYLLPQWPDLWLKEGRSWAVAGEVDKAFETWAAMLRRFPKQAPNLYADVYGLIRDEAALVDRWRLLGRDNKKCLLIFFRYASPVEFRVELDHLLADDPELKAFDAGEKLTLFEAWYRNGDKLELAEALREKSDWRAIAWKQLALAYADYGDYQNACAAAREFASIPPVPEPPAGLSVADLELQARLRPTDIDIAAALCLALAKEDRVEQALARLQALHEVKGFPDYLRNLEAQLWERKGEWGKAWNALRPFVSG
jgi:tetratricopeptide (TPR) repeat protein